MRRVKKYLIIGAAIAALLSAFYFFFGAEETFVRDDGSGIVGSCQEGVLAAQEAALGKICTFGSRTLICPDDALFIYDAPNGCEISFLIDRGWTAVE